MPRQLSRSQFSRRLQRLTDFVGLVFHQLGDTLKDLNLESRYVVDSFPAPVCDKIRIQRCRLTNEFLDKEQFRGALAAKRRYFYGVRAQILATVQGIPVEFALMPGAPSDLQGLSELPLSLPAESHVALDAAYAGYLWEDFAAETDHIKLLVVRRNNSKRDIASFS